MHGHTTPRQSPRDPVAARIAHLSEEYLDATSTRREEIGEEISGLISGNVVPFQHPGKKG